MVILGLGSNIGDRFDYLRQALQLIKQIPQLTVEQVSPIYLSDALLPDNAAQDWDMPYLNLALRCETHLSPNELLVQTKKIEKIVGSPKEKNWGPRVIDIDLLAWDDLIQYNKKLHIPHEALANRPFALWPLADVAPHWVNPLPGIFQGKTAAEMAAQWGSRFDGKAPLHTRQIAQRIDTPALVGILNITPDSFSDSGKFYRVEQAIQHAKHLIATGAEIIDIGAEATGPNANEISSTIEWQRLEPILTLLMEEKAAMPIIPKISVDTRHANTAKQALMLGVDWINDVSSFADPLMANIIAEHKCHVVFMHQMGIPANKTKTIPLTEDPIHVISRWADQIIIQLETQGIKREKLIFDMGIGYNKTKEQDLLLIQKAKLFQQWGIRTLLGHSRKYFLSQFNESSPAERDLETVITSLHLTNQQAVSYLRIHNTELHSRALKVNAAMTY